MAIETQNEALARFEDLITEEALRPLWRAVGPRMSRPSPRAIPYLWRWEHVRQRMFQAAELIPVGRKGAERRVLQFQNPGIGEAMGTTDTLVAGIQFIHGKEVAPSHRHSMAALRWIVEGKGACTVVNGEPESMQVGDLLLTPSWYWHGHYSEHDEPMMWMDGLDVPLVVGLGANFQEDYPETLQPASAPRDESIRTYSSGGLLPIGDRNLDGNSPLLNYRWAQTEERLLALADRDGSPFDGVALEYTNPFTGGPVMPTIDCWIQLLRPGERTRAHRHTGGVIYNVAQGNGYSVIDGQQFAWTRGDVFCVPSWAAHEHANASPDEPAILFSLNDAPVLRALGLYREAPYEGGDHQDVAGTFRPT